MKVKTNSYTRKTRQLKPVIGNDEEETKEGPRDKSKWV